MGRAAIPGVSLRFRKQVYSWGHARFQGPGGAVGLEVEQRVLLGPCLRFAHWGAPGFAGGGVRDSMSPGHPDSSYCVAVGLCLV